MKSSYESRQIVPVEKSATRVDIDLSLVRALVSAQFPGWAHLPIEPIASGGWDNRTFRLGDDMTVRLPSADRYSAQVKKEHRWLPKFGPFLPLPIRVPLAMGAPALGYPWNWSIYRWLEGEDATIARVADVRQFAITLAEFLVALQRIDPTGGPAPGPHNFYRGGSLKIYDAQTRQAIRHLAGTIDRRRSNFSLGCSPEGQMARPASLATWRCERRKFAGHEGLFECCHRLRIYGRRRPRM